MSIVGLSHNDYAGNLGLFDGRTFAVKFSPCPLTTKKGTHLRMAALVDGGIVEFVSTETPVRQGIRNTSLTFNGGATVYAA